MPLRKSPVRTPALLAANRANAQKSTGPRTTWGKRRSALNALRHGRRARLSICWVPQAGREAYAFWRLLAELRAAILPLAGEGDHAVFRTALSAWIAKRLYDRLAASADENRRLRLALGFEPMPSRYRLRIRRPGLTAPDWLVTISIGLAWGRGLGRLQQLAADLEADLAAGREPDFKGRRLSKLPSLHTRLLVTTVGYPYAGATAQPEGSGESDGFGEPQELQTKPESHRKRKTSKNDLSSDSPQPGFPADGETAGVRAELSGLDDGPHDGPGDAEEIPAPLRTKPESIRKHEASKNELPIGNWVRGAISAARRLFARRPGKPPDKDAVFVP
jgi:hypothetical protein